MLPRAPNRDSTSAGLRGWLASLAGGVSAAAAAAARGAGSAAAAAAPWAGWAADVGWMVASSALLLALPIVIEVQREATVRVLQHQRELENQQLQEQARAQAGGFLQQASNFGQLLAGPATPAAAQ